MANVAKSERSSMAPPGEHPCGACPWLVSNHGKPHPDGWYTKANRRRLWGGLRKGEHMTCHPTDPVNPAPSDGSGKPVPEGTITRVCAGAHALIIESVNGHGDSGHPTDRARMTKHGALRHMERIIFGGELFPASVSFRQKVKGNTR